MPAGQGADYEDFKSMCTGKSRSGFKCGKAEDSSPPFAPDLSGSCGMCAVEQSLTAHSLTWQDANLLRLCALSPIGLEPCNYAVKALNTVCIALRNLSYDIPAFTRLKRFKVGDAEVISNFRPLQLHSSAVTFVWVRKHSPAKASAYEEHLVLNMFVCFNEGSGLLCIHCTAQRLCVSVCM